MKMKVSDYIADFLVKNDICQVFTVTGGGAMHLNDSLGHKEGLHCMYNHHEQACAIAAEAYARVNNRLAAVCVTTGPGGTNAMTGVLGAWLDSIPMLVLSGQVRYDYTARSTGLNIRALGDQEFDITKSVSSMTKYAEMVIQPQTIRYHLEKALYLAKTGRPGPCWLDIPLNVQAAMVETDELEGFAIDESWKNVTIRDDLVQLLLQKLRGAVRPVINAGNGIRLAGASELFWKVVEKLNIPVVTGWNSIDLMPSSHPLYVGRAGIMGDRAGNWAIQNSDLLFSIGSRLSVRQVGYDKETWAREAYTIVNDVDAQELKKPTIRVDLPVHGDTKELLELLLEKITAQDRFEGEAWLTKCKTWKDSYPVVQEKHRKQTGLVNVYAFIGDLSAQLRENQLVVVGNGSACVVGSHGFEIKKGQRFLINSGAASMGYDLPAAIGACVASGYERTICVTGDGSIQMNLQELQTIVHHRLPILVFVINNGGYHSIRQTQKNYFGEPLVGIGEDSGDLSFPSMEKLAFAYGIRYHCIKDNQRLKELEEVLEWNEPVICEVIVDAFQFFEPKSASRQLEDGRMVSAPLEDLAPFLDRKELEAQMVIPMMGELER